MSPRKPTVDDLDDVDDEDGVAEQEVAAPADLSLEVRRSDDVGLGGTTPPDDADDEGSEPAR
jgi:hypothetical protein